jgi:hypothetical protein
MPHARGSETYKEADLNHLRIDLIGPLPSFLYTLCKNIGCEISLFSSMYVYLEKTKGNRLNGYILIVSMTLTAEDCQFLQEELSESSVEASFLINDDPETLKKGLSKIKAHAPKAVQGMAKACVDSDFGTLPIPSIRQYLGFENSHLGALFLLGHSDGSCHTINDIAICTQASTAKSKSNIESLPCFSTSECRFQNRSPQTLRVDASSIQSSIIVDLTCIGFGIDSTSPLTRFSFGRAFFTNSSTTALITSLTVTAFSLDDLCLAIYLAKSGYPASKIVRILNRFRSIRGLAITSLIALGDPRARLQPSVMHQCDDRTNHSQNQVLDFWSHHDQDNYDVLLYDNAYYALHSPNGRVYYTSTRAAKPLFTSASTASMRALLSFESLISGLHFAEVYIVSIKQLASECDNDALFKSIENAEVSRISLLLFCLTHNSKVVEPYHSYNTSIIVSTTACAMEALCDFQDALTNTIREAILAKIDVILSGSCYTVLSHSDTGEECVYCSASSSLSIYELVGSSFKRFKSICSQCSALYLGSGAAKFMEIGFDQERLNVKISLSHNIPLELPVFAIVWCKYWNEPPSIPSVSKRQTVGPKETIILETQINMINIDPKGRRMIQAIVLIGPFINMMCRYIVID